MLRRSSLALLWSAAAAAAPYTVSTSDDAGPGSLRQAILEANLDSGPGPVTIDFNIAGVGVQTIAPLSALPGISRPVTLDGYTQPGASPNTLALGSDALLLIQLTGTNLIGGTGLEILASNSVVRGLIINRFSYGINMGLSESNIIEGNFIGADS